MIWHKLESVLTLVCLSICLPTLGKWDGGDILNTIETFTDKAFSGFTYNVVKDGSRGIFVPLFVEDVRHFDGSELAARQFIPGFLYLHEAICPGVEAIDAIVGLWVVGEKPDVAVAIAICFIYQLQKMGEKKKERIS